MAPFYFCAGAQNTISAGPEFSLGKLNHTSIVKPGLGISAEYLARVFPKGGIRVYAGYNHFNKIDNYSDLNILPIRAGYQHFLYSDNLFVYGETGITNFLFSSGNHIGFSFAAGGGYKINLPKARLVQASLSYNYNRYSSLFQYNLVTLRAAYGLKFGKRKAFKREE